MDSLTQIVLGASMGEAVLGKKVGNRAALWGAVAGTIPDLDVIVNVVGSEFDALIYHRGITHSIAFSIVVAPLLGWLIYKLYGGRHGTVREWTMVAFWALFTHPLLDCFTTWGTQLFLPFSDYRVAINSIFVVDPLYTVPFLLCLLVALMLRRESGWRRFWNWTGIGLSSFYLVLTLANKGFATAHFGNALHFQGKSYLRMQTFPTPLNNLLWYVVAEEPSGYDMAYFSLFGDPAEIRFRSIPKNHQLIPQAKENQVIERLRWVSKDLYSLESCKDTIYWRDLRFGIFNGWAKPDEAPQFVFTNQLIEVDGEYVGIHSIRPDISSLTKEDLRVFWRKMWGEP
jgi:inner membrane protein